MKSILEEFTLEEQIEYIKEHVKEIEKQECFYVVPSIAQEEVFVYFVYLCNKQYACKDCIVENIKFNQYK